jgi:hypothetical protein
MAHPLDLAFGLSKLASKPNFDLDFATHPLDYGIALVEPRAQPPIADARSCTAYVGARHDAWIGSRNASLKPNPTTSHRRQNRASERANERRVTDAFRVYSFNSFIRTKRVSSYEKTQFQLLVEQLHLAVARESMLRVLGQFLHPIAQLRRVNVQVLRRLNIGHASILDQAHRLKLELPREFPSLSMTHLQLHQNT